MGHESVRVNHVINKRKGTSGSTPTSGHYQGGDKEEDIIPNQYKNHGMKCKNKNYKMNR